MVINQEFGGNSPLGFSELQETLIYYIYVQRNVIVVGICGSKN